MVWLLRILGVINLLFVASGLFYAIGMLQLHQGHWPESLTGFDWTMIIAFYCVSFACLAIQIFSGVQLIRGKASSLPLLGFVFIFIVVFMTLTNQLDWVMMPAAFSENAVGYWERGLAPIESEFFTGFPIIGGVAVLVLFLLNKRKSHV